jgi:hypothetical protein
MLPTNTPLDEIRRLHDGRQTGLLAFAGNDGERIDVFFREGLIDAVSSNLENHRLGEYLAKDASVPAKDLDAAASEGRRRKISFGEAVVLRKLVDQVDVVAAARCQSMDLLERVINNDFAVDSFSNYLRGIGARKKPDF